MAEVMIREGRSLEVTPTWSVATVTTVMVFVCLFAERSIYKFGKWLKKTKRKALFASLEKIKEELMLLGLISLLLGQWARWISQICVNSSLFSSKFYLCSEEDYGETKRILLTEQSSSSNGTDIPPKGISYVASHACGEGREPFVSAEGLEQLHRFLFVLGITHVLYSCITVGLAMSKIYSWRKWEIQASVVAEANAQAKHKVMRRQSTFALHHASHPWSRSRVLIWMNHKLPLSYNFHKYMVRSMEDEFYGIVGIVGISWPLWGYAILCIFINIHGLNIYFWLSFIPVILVMLVGTKLQHVVSLLALEIAEPRGPSVGTQVKPRDELFWFGKPEILLRLIQFISFQVR
ncbi:UNVERIFIED_CONTAM: MLO-like protein 4 [Sesamum radiatum]|uniref:MLO-like protein 4 n=1 Tax=Sesamum radiatum TaxID=300843 RepID=A0AAW2U7E6_SESRA